MVFKKVNEGSSRVSAVLSAAALASLLIGDQSGYADVCIQEAANKSLVCTANDIQVAFADNIRDTSGNPLTKCLSGTQFSFIADFHVTTTASSRYDIGLYFATDGDPNGDGARSGVCSANMITDSHLDPESPNKVMLGSRYAVNLDGDACRDVTTGAGWGPPNGRVVTVRVDNVMCTPGANGYLSLPNCTSWSQNTGGVCMTPQDTAPGSPSKCSCNIGFTVPIFVETGTINVKKTASPSSLPEPGGEFTFDVAVTNASQVQSVTLDRICDDHYGTIATTAGQPACPAGSLPSPVTGQLTNTYCSLSPAVTLAPGATFTCSFTGTANSLTVVQNITDTVTVYGHDASNHPVQQNASATVAITSVPPTALVTKSYDSVQCATLRYNVGVQNTDAAKSLTLSALTDSAFGDITTASGAIDATTCSVGGTIASGATYSCHFDATFCGTTNTDTVTATLVDADNNTIKPTSNSVTVNVSAQQQP